MRTPKYLSPTSIKLFIEDKEEFFFRYLSDTKIPRFAQTEPMAAGAAFDAFIKSYLHQSLFGKIDNRFDLKTIFEEQVDLHNRDFGWAAGEHIFNEYKEAGCAADLMLELSSAVGSPRFEFSIMSTIDSDIGDIPLLGKPDTFFINDQGARVVYDFKINGYCSPRTKSPMKGYVKLREKIQGKWYHKMHKDCEFLNFKGILINKAMNLEDGNRDWGDQLAIYSWLLGEPIGSEEVIFGIDQGCGPKEKLRFATHRLKISPDYQYNLFELIKQIWKCIKDEHLFQEMTKEESLARCELLEKQAKIMCGEEREELRLGLGGLYEAGREAFRTMVS